MPKLPAQYGRRKPAKRQGGSVTKRDTSASYKRLRLAILDQESLCRYCRNQGRITAATIVDHVLALSLGGSNDRGNLAPCCKPCNDAKAVHEMRYVARGYDLASVKFDPDLAEWFRLAARII